MSVPEVKLLVSVKPNCITINFPALQFIVENVSYETVKNSCESDEAGLEFKRCFIKTRIVKSFKPLEGKFEYVLLMLLFFAIGFCRTTGAEQLHEILLDKLENLNEDVKKNNARESHYLTACHNSMAIQKMVNEIGKIDSMDLDEFKNYRLLDDFTLQFYKQ